MAVSNLSVLRRDVDGQLVVTADHPKLTDGTKMSLVQMLEEAPVMRGTTATMPDLIDPSRGDVVGLSIRTDGRWVWNDSVLYYLKEHDIAPPPEFVGFHQLTGFGIPQLTPAEISEVEAFLA